MNFYGTELPTFRANLHTHSTVSDGGLTPAAAIQAYAEAGYDVLAFSDHRRTNPVAQYESPRMTLLSGIELHPMGPRGIFWHLLALGVPADFPGEFPTAQAAIDAVNAVHGVVFCAHPHWCGLTSGEILELHGLSGIEVYNTSCRYIGKAFSDQCYDELIDAGWACGALAVDDMHSSDALFGGWTMIAAPDRSPEALIDALRQGRYYATQGPRFTRLSFENGVFEADFSEAVEAVVIGRRSSGKVVAMPNFPAPGDHPTVTTLRVETSARMLGAMRCRIRDAQGRFAWSPPVVWGD